MTDMTYNPQAMWQNFIDAQGAVNRVDYQLRRKWLDTTDHNESMAFDLERDKRKWISREIDAYPLHPVIEASVMASRPHDWQQLFLEWPHISQGDRSKIAYTQNEDKGRRNIQTVTSVGKYLRRHFPALSDHEIRDLSARYGTAAVFKFVHTTAEMIYHLHKGPGSCMVWRDDRGVRCSDGVTRHPYEAYDPKYGWHMAVRIEGDDTIGRALCMTSPRDDKKYYVRTYARPANNGGYSETDNAMENWLTEQGYHKLGYWRDGEKLAYHETGDHFLAPYLDGNEKRVGIVGSNMYVVVDSDGEYICDQTGGCPTYESDDYFDCDDCGDSTSNDDGYWAGRQEDAHVCNSCLENNYRYAYGRRGNQYYVHEDNCVYVESCSDYYDVDYLSDNEIVELNNGEYEQLEYAIEVDGDWYHIEDERICRTEDTDEFLLVDDCWQCEESGNWYSEDTEYVEVDGNKYHPDHAPDQDDDEEDTQTMLTMEMLDKVLMIWDYTIHTGYVQISLTYTHDGRTLYAKRNFSREFMEGVDSTMFTKQIRNELSTELMLQAHNNSVATI